jgi:hypothetical protein
LLSDAGGPAPANPDEISHAGPVAIIRTAPHCRARLLCVLVACVSRWSKLVISVMARIGRFIAARLGAKRAIIRHTPEIARYLEG